jgi:hypothetical protein
MLVSSGSQETRSSGSAIMRGELLEAGQQLDF